MILVDFTLNVYSCANLPSSLLILIFQTSEFDPHNNIFIVSLLPFLSYVCIISYFFNKCYARRCLAAWCLKLCGRRFCLIYLNGSTPYIHSLCSWATLGSCTCFVIGEVFWGRTIISWICCNVSTIFKISFFYFISCFWGYCYHRKWITKNSYDIKCSLFKKIICFCF